MYALFFYAKKRVAHSEQINWGQLNKLVSVDAMSKATWGRKPPTTVKNWMQQVRYTFLANLSEMLRQTLHKQPYEAAYSVYCK